MWADPIAKCLRSTFLSLTSIWAFQISASRRSFSISTSIHNYLNALMLWDEIENKYTSYAMNFLGNLHFHSYVSAGLFRYFLNTWRLHDTGVLYSLHLSSFLLSFPFLLVTPLFFDLLQSNFTQSPKYQFLSNPPFVQLLALPWHGRQSSLLWEQKLLYLRRTRPHWV